MQSGPAPQVGVSTSIARGPPAHLMRHSGETSRHHMNLIEKAEIAASERVNRWIHGQTGFEPDITFAFVTDDLNHVWLSWTATVDIDGELDSYTGAALVTFNSYPEARLFLD